MRILLVTHIPPYPARRTGAGQRAELLRRALQTCGPVDLLLISEPQQPGAITAELTDVDGNVLAQIDCRRGPAAGLRRIVRALRWRLIKPMYPYHVDKTLHAAVAGLVREHGYDVVVGRYLLPAMVAGLAKIRGPRRLLDCDDYEWEKFRLRCQERTGRSWLKRLYDRWLYRRFRRRGLAELAQFDNVWCVSREDKELLGLPNLSLLPNIPFGPAVSAEWAPCPPDDDSKTILFVGDLLYTPNKDGLRRFLQSIWPKVSQAAPDAKLMVVSSRLADDLRDEMTGIAGVEVVGFVEDLRDAYAACALSIAPVYWGGGTKIKILESLCYGRTCVLAPHSLYGLGEHLLHGESVWVGSDDEGFAQGCIELLTDPARRRAMAETGYDVVMSAYSVSHFTECVVRPVRSPGAN